MKTIMKRELRNYLKNPILWIGLLIIIVDLYQILNPFLKIHYFQSEKQIEALKPADSTDADITDGYIQSDDKTRMKHTCKLFKKGLAELLDISKEEAGRITDDMYKRGLSIDEMDKELSEKYKLHVKNSLLYDYELSEYHKAGYQEFNAYLKQKFKEHSFSFYFSRKFADFCGLNMGFFAAILLAFLFIRDMRKDTYELLHTKPVSATAYACGKIGGGFLAMAAVWGMLSVLFGALCEYYGRSAGFPVSVRDFLQTAAVYILPNMLMITCIYAAVALIFKNPIPAVPLLFLYMIYSNMGSKGPDGVYGYYGRPLAIMVRFPGSFFDTAAPPLALMNQIFLVCASTLVIALVIKLWKRRRVY